jgi:hypothetical protein
MKVKQLICNVGPHFYNGLKEKYHLVPFIDRTRPVFVFGCYNVNQLNAIINHRPGVILCWAGSDILWFKRQKDLVSLVKDADHIRHIAISNYIVRDLEEISIPYKVFPVLPYKNDDIKPEPLGDAIYIYKSDSVFYGKAIYDRLKVLMPDMSFIECGFGGRTRKEVIDNYKMSFLGLRFTPHDGLSNTACEMGLMGRRIIWNGNTPNAIPFDRENIDKIISDIRNEYENRKEADYVGISQKMSSYLKMDDDFLNI